MPSGGGGAGGARRSVASPLARSSGAPSHGPIMDMATAIRLTAIRLTVTGIRPIAMAIRPTATATRGTTATEIGLITVSTAHVISAQQPSIAQAMLVAALSRVSSRSVVDVLKPRSPRGFYFPFRQFLTTTRARCRHYGRDWFRGVGGRAHQCARPLALAGD